MISCWLLVRRRLLVNDDEDRGRNRRIPFSRGSFEGNRGLTGEPDLIEFRIRASRRFVIPASNLDASLAPLSFGCSLTSATASFIFVPSAVRILSITLTR